MKKEKNNDDILSKIRNELYSGMTEEGRKLSDMQTANNSDLFNQDMGKLYGITGSVFEPLQKLLGEKNELTNFKDAIGGDKYKAAYDEVRNFNEQLGQAKSRISVGLSPGMSISTPNITDGMKNFLEQNSAVNQYNKRLDNLNRMKNVYLDGIDREAAKNFISGKQTILDAQRKYGITGATAAAQMRDFELKHSQAHIDSRNKMMSQFDQQYGQTKQRLLSEQNLAQAAALKAAKQKAQSGKTTPAELKELLSQQGLDTSKLRDEDLQSWILNPNT